MENSEKISKEEWYIEHRLQDQIDYYDSRSIFYKRWYSRLIASDIIISALISFVAIFSSYPFTKYLIAIMGASVTVISGFLSVFQFQKKWIEYRSTAETLIHEKFTYEMGVEPYNSEDKLKVLVNNVETLISKENTNWAYYIQRLKITDSRKDDANE